MKAWRFVVALLFISVPTLAQQQQPAWPPVLRDLGPKHRLPPDGTFDILGMELGATPAIIEAKFKELFPGATPNGGNAGIGIGDNRGNSVQFLHFPETSIYFRGNDGVTENARVTFTTKVNESRAFQIARTVNYPDATQASLPELLAALKQKYGAASYENRRNIQSRYFTLHFVWYDGRRVTVSEEQIAREQYSSPPSPAKCLNVSTSAYSFNNSRRDEAPGCIAHMSVQINLGKRDDLVRSIEFQLRDIRRSYDNNVETDKFLTDEFEKKVRGTAAGTKTRL